MGEHDESLEPAPAADRPARPGGKIRVIDAATLFQGAREVLLEMSGIRYRLRITRRNNLMLDKA